MFGKKKDLSIYKAGDLRPAGPIKAPSLKFARSDYAQKIDLRQYCSTIEDQRNLGSCNACSVVGALEFLANKNGQRGTELSILFLYYNARKLGGTENEDSGLLASHAAAAVMAYGVCEDRLWPYETEKFTMPPPQECFNNAQSFEAMQYARLGRPEDMKMALTQGVPVIVGTGIPKTYYDATKTDGKMPSLGECDDTGYCGHSMLFVGYDDREQTWLVRNSWGKDWADDGYVRIPYSLLDRYTPSDNIWVIGALERHGELQLEGPSVKEAVADTVAHAGEQMMAALAKLKTESRATFQSELDAAKKSVRDRLRGPGA
jgi:C1A family cysteine protease